MNPFVAAVLLALLLAIATLALAGCNTKAGEPCRVDFSQFVEESEHMPTI